MAGNFPIFISVANSVVYGERSMVSVRQMKRREDGRVDREV